MISAHQRPSYNKGQSTSRTDLSVSLFSPRANKPCTGDEPGSIHGHAMILGPSVPVRRGGLDREGTISPPNNETEVYHQQLTDAAMHHPSASKPQTSSSTTIVGLPGCRATWVTTPCSRPDDNSPSHHLLLLNKREKQEDTEVPLRQNSIQKYASSPLRATDYHTAPPPSFCPFLPRALQPKEHLQFLNQSLRAPGASDETSRENSIAPLPPKLTVVPPQDHANRSPQRHATSRVLTLASHLHPIHRGATSASSVIDRCGGKDAFMRLLHDTYHPPAIQPNGHS